MKARADRGVVAQVRAALKRGNRLATALGFLLGGFVPIASYVVAHHELALSEPLWAQRGSYLVLGGLAYSAKTVWQWGTAAFHSTFKSIGFVVLLEGVMVTSSTVWLAYASLAFLVFINGTATACNLTGRTR